MTSQDAARAATAARRESVRNSDALARQRAITAAAAERRDGDSRIADSEERRRAIVANRGDRGRVTDRSSLRFRDPSRFSSIDRRVVYTSYPRNYYRLSYADGWRGRGWYYGPPGFPYYYESPNVFFYALRSLIPSTYVNLRYSPTSSLDYSVQRELAERGYYYGPLDGRIGPESRMAIANFQADNGLEPTGIIDEVLLSYLGI